MTKTIYLSAFQPDGSLLIQPSLKDTGKSGPQSQPEAGEFNLAVEFLPFITVYPTLEDIQLAFRLSSLRPSQGSGDLRAGPPRTLILCPVEILQTVKTKVVIAISTKQLFFTVYDGTGLGDPQLAPQSTDQALAFTAGLSAFANSVGGSLQHTKSVCSLA